MHALYQILNQSHQLQQLTPEEGPTALAFHYAQLNVLIKEFIGSHPTQENYLLAWSMLDKQGRTELSDIIDQYARLKTRRQVKRVIQPYEQAFRQLQHHILAAVSLLS